MAEYGYWFVKTLTGAQSGAPTIAARKRHRREPPRNRRNCHARTLGRECGGKNTPRGGKKPAPPEAFISVTPPARHLKAANRALARLELDIKTISGCLVRRTA